MLGIHDVQLGKLSGIRTKVDVQTVGDGWVDENFLSADVGQEICCPLVRALSRQRYCSLIARQRWKDLHA